MKRDDILEKLKEIEGGTWAIRIFDSIEDQILNSYFTKEEHMVMLLRIREKYSNQKPESGGRYAAIIWRSRDRDQSGKVKMRRSRYTITKQVHDLLIKYIDDLIDQMRPSVKMTVRSFREALNLKNKDAFINAIRPHLKQPKSYAHLYFALSEAGVIASMETKEAHLILTAEFGDIGSYQNFNKHLNNFNYLRTPSWEKDAEAVKIDRFVNIINQYQ